MFYAGKRIQFWITLPPDFEQNMLGSLLIRENPPAVSMKPILCQNWLRDRTWRIVLVFTFFCFTSACVHPAGKSSSPNPPAEISSTKEARTANAPSGEDPWWKKPEYEWLIGTLIFVGIGVAVGGVIMISSGAGGLRINVHN
jgi:hypothetical protein